MRELVQKLAQEVAGTGETSGRRFAVSKGVFFFPNGLCPFCHGAMRSPMVWHLGTASLKGRWKVVGRANHKKLKRDATPNHPHIATYSWSSGQICLGDSGADAPTALFFGMNARGAHYGWHSRARWWPWLRRVWNHDCPENPSFRGGNPALRPSRPTEET